VKEHKNKFVAAIVILAVLIGAWFLGGAPEINHPTPDVQPITQFAEAHINTENSVPIEAEIVLYSPKGEPDSPEELFEPEEPDEPYKQYKQGDAQHEASIFDIIPEIANQDQFETTPEGVVVPHINPENIQVLAADHSEMRAPVEPEEMVIGDGSFTVILSVRVHTVLYNMHLLHRDKHELVPEDGWIFPPTEVVAYEGESVFNVLQREMRRHRIHMVSRWTPIFNSAYVEAINNLYEFDVGPLSGWMYSVNGWFPNFGASRYMLSPGDVIEWVYTVDLGRDLGVLWIGEANE